MGRFHVYTGDGKGKTTTAMGMAMRALGQGQRVVIIQFLKGQDTGEAKLGDFNGLLTFKQFGSESFVFDKKETDYTNAINALNFVFESLKNRPNLMILDEINVAVSMGLIKLEDALRIVDMCPEETELVFTGRGAHEEIIKRADLVTEMKMLKHYFYAGKPAKKGIEF